MRGEWEDATPDAVLAFWFPDDGHDASHDAHRAFWKWRMRGSCDDSIRSRFADLTEAAAKGFLDHWAATPRGRLALVIVLDQFSRSVWRETPAAFSQDIKAARLVLGALRNGQYEALQAVWEKAFYLIALSHCEGPEHLERMDRVLALSAALVEEAPEHLRLSYRMVEDQGRLGREVIARFGRHPHRNAILGRPSTREEEAYVAAGVFPHQRAIPETREGLEELLAKRQSLVEPADRSPPQNLAG
jgi:uncharacterized protein (DUF924 family)